MTALGSQPSSPSESVAGAGRRPSVPAVLWSRSEDTRLLLRGLLRLHRYSVVLEAATVDDLGGTPTATGPRILVVDAEEEETDWPRDLTVALQAHPELTAVVVLPRDLSAADGRARFPGARAVVSRPFAIRDLVAALDQAAEGIEPPHPPGLPVTPPTVRQR
jgi:AmiR/NasT family two-component response regulator